ncbi:MAG TPA: LysR substrate-binding domain-containing protein [Stellaceae bacterium]|nr:LysR substrate-binding domain-containing protein [Stellaceae bacterium]
MAFRLPPLSSLRVFEAAARHGSFRKAADELNLTASAVSHGIQTLENWLGVELFYRESRGLRLTDAGEAYAPFVNQALTVLANATEQLPGRAATGTLSLSSAPTIANRILLPRLERFAAQFPDIRLTIDTSHRLVDLTLDDFDVAIRPASMKKPAPNWTLLATETLVPVCSRQLKETFGAAGLADLLSRAPLIHVTSVSADWSHWFRANGMEMPAAIEDGLRVDTMQMAFEAAIRGLGVVLGRRPLVDDDLAAGRLVPLTAKAIPSGNGYWLVTSQTEFQKPEVKQFRRWLLSELGAGADHHDPARAASQPVTAPARPPRARPASR